MRVWLGYTEMETAGPSAPLRSGRDDKGRVGFPLDWLRDERHCGSLGFAPPDFLLNLVALAHIMRLSLRERRTCEFVWCRVAGNPGRDDKGESGFSVTIC
jgi:hypothetical protein